MKKTNKPKKITAPLTHNPGGGRPKEHLAYLNWQEMEALRRLNGNNMERGPKGLPSFADDSASSKGVSRGGQGAVGSGSTKTATGSVSNRSVSPSRGGYGGGSSSAAKTSQPSGALSRGSGAGTGAQSRAAASQPAGRSTGPSSALNAPNRTQPSTDTKAKQQVESRSASSALRSSPSLKNDIRSGGINQIRVGPMGQPVDMGGRIKGAISQVASSTYRKVTPTAPGGGGMGGGNARRGSSTVAVGSGMEAPGNIATGSFYGEPPSRAARMDRLQADMDRYRLSQAYGNAKQITDRVPIYNYERPLGPNLPSKATLSDQEMATRLAEMNRIQSMPDWQFDENRYSWLKAPAGGPIGAPQKPAFDKYKALRAYDSPYGPERPVEGRASMEQTLRDYRDARNVTIPDSGVRKTTTPYSEMGPVRMDPSVMGRAAQAEANYRTVTGAGLGAGVAAREYVDPDIARSRSLGEVFNDAARNVSDYFRSPPTTTAPYQQPTEMTPEERAAINNLRDRYALYNASVTPKMSPVVEQAAPVAGSEFAKSPTPGFGKLYSDRLPQAEGGVASLVSTSPSTTTAFRTPAPSEGEKVISVENVPVQVERARRGTEVVTNIFKTNPRTLATDLRNQVTDEINARRPTSENTAIGVPGPETPSYDTTDGYNASPSQGGLTKEQSDILEGDLDRTGAVIRGGGIAAGLASGVPISPVSNKAYKMYSEAKLKQLEDYAGMTTEQKAEAERKNPELIGWATRLGIPSPGKYQTYRDWAQRSGLIGSGATTGGGLIDKFGIASLPAAQDSDTGTRPTTSTGVATDTGYTSGPRPYIYYQWDLGVNIPSPSDPKYTEYQKYLAGRAAASSSYG